MMRESPSPLSFPIMESISCIKLRTVFNLPFTQFYQGMGVVQRAANLLSCDDVVDHTKRNGCCIEFFGRNAMQWIPR